MQDFDFSDGFPSIEVDVEYFKSLSHIDRIKYIAGLVFQDSGLSDRLKLMEYIVSTLSVVSDSFVKNDDFKEYIKLIHSGTKLMGVSNAIGNFVRAKQSNRNKKNDAIAKMMGFANGQFIDECRLDANAAMIDSFIDMSDSQMTKYGIKVENFQDNNKSQAPSSKEGDEEQTSTIKNITMTGTIDINDSTIKWGAKIKSMGNSDEGATNSSTCSLYYPVHKLEGLTSDDLKDEISSIMTQVFVEKVNKYQNYIKIKGRQFDIATREDINAKIRNIDMDSLVLSMNNTLNNEKRRGIILAGEPGVGKTIAVHKLVNQFRDTLVFWVSAESLQSTKGIRDTFKTFKLFKNSIIIFDDIDSADLTSKDEITQVFLEELDGTSKLTGFVIGVVNDPSLIHPALIGRPERFDEAIEVKKPTTPIEISEILVTQATNCNYYSFDALDNMIDLKSEVDNQVEEIDAEIKEIKEKANADEELSHEDEEFIATYDVSDEAKRELATIEILTENEYSLYDVDSESDEYNEFVKSILSIPPEGSSIDERDAYVKKQFTQVMVAGLITHCEAYSTSPIINLDDLKKAYDKRLQSIEVASLVATKGRLKVDSNGMSDEARANLGRHK
jgi:DNA polymerase III delta prime subunit